MNTRATARPTSVTYDLTRLERVALRAIAESEYHDCAPTDCAVIGSTVWSGADYLGGSELTRRNISGVLSSLSKKA
jgi:hypothetical protein